MAAYPHGTSDVTMTFSGGDLCRPVPDLPVSLEVNMICQGDPDLRARTHAYRANDGLVGCDHVVVDWVSTAACGVEPSPHYFAKFLGVLALLTFGTALVAAFGFVFYKYAEQRQGEDGSLYSAL